MKNTKVITIAALVSLIGALSFLVLVLNVPLSDDFNSPHTVQRFSNAAADVVNVGDLVSIPITFTSTEPVTAGDFTVAISGGVFENITCGSGTFETLSISSGLRCIVYSPTGQTSGTVAYVVVKATQPGTIGVSVSGSMSTNAATIPAGLQLIGGSRVVVNGTIAVGDTINVPLSCTANEFFTGADFTVTASSGTIQSLVCGGSGFVSVVTNSGARCVLINNPAPGGSGGVVGTARVVATQTGVLSVSITKSQGQPSLLSNQLGVAPAGEQCTGATYTVAGDSAATPTPTPSPTPTGSSNGSLSVDTIESPTYSDTVTLSGNKSNSGNVFINGGQLSSVPASSTIWSEALTLLLGNNMYTIEEKDTNSGSVIGTVTIIWARHGMGDINGDATVNVFDVGIFAGSWGQTGINSSSPANVRLSNMQDNDTVVDVLDLGILAGVYNQTYTYI